MKVYSIRISKVMTQLRSTGSSACYPNPKSISQSIN